MSSPADEVGRAGHRIGNIGAQRRWGDTAPRAAMRIPQLGRRDLPDWALFAGLRAALVEVRMIPFFVQIKCQLGKSYQVANALADAEIASEIYSTAGEFDLLVKFYIDAKTDIGHFINEKVQTIPGIQDTRTIITFKAF
jgi:DNA-binding Lrp family transcriptional regulator